MKKYALLACFALPLGGCNSATTSATIATIEQVATTVIGNGGLAAACTIFAQAETYFNEVAPQNSTNNITLGKIAIATATGICPPNPAPTSVTAALTDLNAAWVALEAATTVPVTPTPTPTSN